MIRVNLLEIREELKRVTLRNQLILLAIVWSMAIGGVVSWRMAVASELEAVKQRKVQLTQEIAKLKKIIGEVEKVKKQKSEIEQKLATIRLLEADRKFVVMLLNQLSSIVPETLWLTQLEYAEDGLQLKGEALDTQVYGTFVKQFRELPVIEETSVLPGESKQSTKSANAFVEFQLQARVVKPTPENYVTEEELGAQ